VKDVPTAAGVENGYPMQLYRWLRTFPSRLRSVLRPQAADRDLDDELRYHLDLKTQENVARGMTPQEAQRQARIALGGVEQVKEQIRAGRTGAWLGTLAQDVRFGLRMLGKNPGFTAVAVLTLALGIGANTAMFSIVDAWLLRPLPLKNPQQLVSVWRTRSQAPRQPAYFDLYHDYRYWSDHNTSFQSLAAVFQWEYTLVGRGEPEEIHGAAVSWNFFQTIGATPQIGRLFKAEDVQSAPACIISHDLWKERFHLATDVVGQSLELNRKQYLVVGVLPAGFSLRVLDRPYETAVWTVITVNEKRYSANSPSPVAVIGRLSPGATVSRAESELSGLQIRLNRQFTDEPENSGVLVANLQEDNTRTIRSSLWLLFGAVGLLMMIACVNAGSLILGRNAQRSKEFAVRVALGCGAGRLFAQLTAEITTIFAFGGLVGLAIAFGLLRMFTAWSPFGILPAGGLSLNSIVLACTALAVGLTALLFGSLPALHALHVRDLHVLRSGAWSTASRAQLRSRSIFVTTEISLSVVLLVGAGLLISTFIRIDSEPLGFQTRDVFVGDVALPRAVYPTRADQARLSTQVLQKVRALPGIQAAGAALSWPFNVEGLTSLETEKQQGLPFDQLPRAATFEVSPGYFDALRVPLLRGRVFGEEDRANSAPVAVINDEMASKYFGAENPIGRHIRLRYSDQLTPSEPWLTIVGIVGDTRSIRYNHVQWDRYPAVYTSFFQHSAEFVTDIADTQKVYIYIRGPHSIDASMISAAVHSIDPTLPLGELQITGEIVSALRAQPRVRATLIGILGTLTLLLAAIGVAGVIGQMVEHRRHDIGIRVALGAQPRDVMRLVVGEGARLALFGIVLGLICAWAAARLMTAFLYGVKPVDPLTFVGVSLILLGVALAAAYIPARRAMRVDPMVALRHE
jgi:predicted permease